MCPGERIAGIEVDGFLEHLYRQRKLIGAHLPGINFLIAVVPPSLSINDVTVTEGDSGSTNASFTVTLSGVSSNPVSLDFFTSNGSSAEPGDYTAVNGTLSFAPGQTTRTINVPVNGDTTPEPNETFFVNLANPTNADIADGQGIGTINDDDASGVIQFSASTSSAAGHDQCKPDR
jgi:hypothetical protein